MKKLAFLAALLAAPPAYAVPVVDVIGTTPIQPVVSASLEASHVLTPAPGRLFSVYASNLTGGVTGFLQVFDLAAVPADGSVTPKVCVPFSNGVASANYQGIPPGKFVNGIVVVISSGSDCMHKTTGVLTGFISGMVQ